MDNIADQQIRAARTLFNLAHCYLKTTKIDVEQEKKNIDDEKDEVTKKDTQPKKEKEAKGNKSKKIVKKKERKKCNSDNELELYLQVQVDSKYQQQICTGVQNENLKNAQQNPEIEIELKIEIPKELENSYLENVDRENLFEEEAKKKFKKSKQTENKQELINQEISDDSGFQNNPEKEIRLKQNINKDDIIVDVDGKNINFSKTKNQIQKGIETKSQEKNNSDVLLELELQEQQNKHENLIESLNKSIQKRIERLICEIPLKDQKINKELCQEIEELHEKFKKLDSGNLNEIKRMILEDVSNKDYLPLKIKYFKNLYCSFNQDLIPFYNKLDQLSNDLTLTSIQRKLNEEFLKKLDNLLLQKNNEEIREVHQPVNSKVIHTVNEEEVEEKEKLKLKDELKRTAELRVNDEIKNNKKIKENESQLKNIDEKEKYNYYDLVIQYNQEMSQELKEHKHVFGKKLSVDFYDDAVKTFINKTTQDALKEKICKEGIGIIDQTQKESNKNVHFQLEFYKSIEVEDNNLQEKNEKQLKNHLEGETNKDFEIKTKEIGTEVQEDSDVEIENFEEKLQDCSEFANDENFKVLHENTKLKIGALEKPIVEDSEKQVQEDSDVDIEGFEGEILQEFPKVEIENFDNELQENSDVDIENVSEEEFNDLNEVVEIVEDIEVESNYSSSSVDNYTPSEKTTTTTCDESDLKINPNSKLKHSEKENLKIIDASNSTILADHIKEKQTFFELKHQLDELSQEYKAYMQQKVFNELEQEIDDKQLQEIKIFPDTFNEMNLNTNEDFQKEIDELQSELSQLEPEFISDVPLSFDEDNSRKKLKEKPYNLFEKLHFIHRQQLCKFANSKEWPENCFQPSSLLDVLFDDPTEFKPNVLVLILHSIDKGYSIKINTDKNSKSPKEYFFNYFKDTILEYMENEHLPPDLLDLLDSAEPRLFYSGCVIAEIHDQVDEVPGRVYRLLLRPFNMSIQSDINRIIAKNSHPTNTNYWSYKKRLKLESILLKKSYPVMCMDSSPITGLVVNLQHQMLSCRTIVLNPLKRRNNCSNQKPLKTDLHNESNDNISTSMLSNEPQKESSKLMNTENMNSNYILWKFDFRVKSLNLLKLFIIVITETLELSLLLCTNSKVDSIKKMRFKILLKQNELKTYINIMLEILRQKICPDIEVVRRYKCQDNSAPLSIRNVPSLFNNNIYKASHADISQLIDIFINNTHIKYIPINNMLKNMFEHNSEMNKFESEKSDLSFKEDKLAADTYKTAETKENSRDLEIKNSMQFCATKKLSTSSKKFLDLSKTDLIDKMINILPLKTQIIPKNILLDDNTICLSKEMTININRDSSLKPSIKRPTLDLSKLDSIDKIADFSSLQTRTISKGILLDDDTSLLKETSTTIETDSSFEPSLIMPIHGISKNDNFSDLVQEKILSVSSNTMSPVFSFTTTTKPFESSPVVVLSSLSKINSLVTSIKTYMLPIESSSLSYIAKSESMSLQTDENLLTFTDDCDIYTNIKLLPVMEPEDLIHLTRVDDIAVNMFYGINPVTSTTCNDDTIIMSQNENIVENISVMKHTNENEVDLFGTIYNINDNEMSQLHDTTNCSIEILEDKYMLRCLQLFHQKPTLPDISILHNTQDEAYPKPDFSNNSLTNSELLSDVNSLSNKILSTSN